MMMTYPGLVPSNVSKDAKYSVRNGESGWEVHLLYRVSSRERALLANSSHQRLVEMVNEVKEQYAGAPGGAFYINEFSDVLVPAGEECYFAGIYENLLEFDFDGTVISPQAAADLSPGDPWPGPHVGVRYTLVAGANDIKYELRKGRITREERLSDYVSDAAARGLAKRLAKVKGESGGRIYINECCQFFGPAPVGDGHVYLGALDDDPWFPPPDVPGRT